MPVLLSDRRSIYIHWSCPKVCANISTAYEAMASSSTMSNDSNISNNTAGQLGSFSQLQHLLQLSYSDKPDEQQKAAVNLAKLVEGTVFPAVSFGPLAHALCRLVPSQNRT